MLSICSTLHLILVPPWKNHNSNLVFHHSKSQSPFFKLFPHSLHTINSLSRDENQLGYDPSDELYGIDVNIPPRDVKSDAFEPRSWFGPNGQYIKELPCPSCRGRGYTPCAECGIERSRQDCSLCSGKGIMTCQQCLGERVIWEESIDEIPWEKARSISPLKVKEDDEVDNLELKLNSRKKSKRVYRSTPPEVGLKISRSLKSLNAKTGLFSKSMKIIHRDPALHAQRVAAIKKAKGTPAARKHTSETLKNFFSDPENRRKRSISMKGIKFFCKNCGQEGHRSYYCPERGENTERRFRCGLCGEKGHNRRTCQKPRTSKPKQRILKEYHCRSCGKTGHNRRTCSLKTELQSDNVIHENKSFVEHSKGCVKKHHHRCSVCGKGGHNSRTCFLKTELESETVGSLMKSKGYVRKHLHRCSVCGKSGHNSKTCSLKTKLQSDSATFEYIGSLKKIQGNAQKHNHRCSVCLKRGHNSRTCSLKTKLQSDSVTLENKGSSQKLKGNLQNHHHHHYRCSVCGKSGHNMRTCSEHSIGKFDVTSGFSQRARRLYHCKICGVLGHNLRTCAEKGVANNVYIEVDSTF
ncbi:zinc finger protein 439-like [Chenopodium quinoa]|uniref:zinc finger protein 439-like n=1 Tax=Chenopodium quinoa TaxID=63459 RepID=UPI000B7972EE|nr:zinc finger protein 439-like [Chenopodium quinoa]